ncbi:hypothetical protein BVC80_8579g14 [Macleaya cordata]|uniref:Endonuclease/exonuclease/phosphatase n=1 Tax=Macleaya cordata TaxID=56857 RepID=A0A200QLL3_MACCD|nr:hypothetical protein BVC80_8579g14 [Macleaya cordata]
MMKVTDYFIKTIWGGNNFGWRWIPSIGRSGGLILIWDEDILNLEDEQIGNHSISVQFGNIDDNFKWGLTNAYAPNESTGRKNFWKELDNVRNWWAGAWVVTGDFNSIRNQGEILINQEDAEEITNYSMAS